VGVGLPMCQAGMAPILGTLQYPDIWKMGTRTTQGMHHVVASICFELNSGVKPTTFGSDETRPLGVNRR
jgi:hypothetical protein